MTEGKIERIRLPGLQCAKIWMKAGDILPLHDHPQSSVCMHVIEGVVKMQIFRRINEHDGLATLSLVKEYILHPGDTATLERGDETFHQVECIEDSFVFDAFSCDDPDGCVSTFYEPVGAIDLDKPFDAKAILTEEAVLPDYFYS